MQNSIVELFEEVASKDPHTKALISNATSESYSYQELREIAQKISFKLKLLGVKEGARVGISTANTADGVKAILGILYAGCSYVPIDPNMPPKLFLHIVKEAEPCLILKSHDIQTDNINNVSIVNIEGILQEKISNSSFVSSSKRVIEDEVYVIFTSGSTGLPKGISVSNRNLLNLLDALKICTSFEKPFTGSIFCPLSFDVSAWEIFSVLLYGGTLIVPNLTDRRDIDELYNFLMYNKIKSAYLPAGLLEDLGNIVEKDTSELYIERLLVGVEPIKAGTIHKFVNGISNIKVINAYGPTETTICATAYLVRGDENPDSYLPIGKSLVGYKVFVADENLNILPNNTLGEIIIAGKGVSNGYLNKELISGKFIEHNVLGRLYRTGDFGIVNENGDIEFKGRNDRQVKLRGYRVELQQIELASLKIDDVKRTLAHYFTDSGQVFLYVECARLYSVAQFNSILEHYLPNYLLPLPVQFFKKFPETRNGKIDIAKLLTTTIFEGDTTSEISSNEKGMLSIWKSILKNDAITVESSFIANGGSSLQAMRIVHKWHQETGKRIEIGDLLQDCTVRYLIDKYEFNDSLCLPDLALETSVKLRGNKQALWTIAQMYPDYPIFHLPVLLEFNSTYDLTRLHKCLVDLIKKTPVFNAVYIKNGKHIYESIVANTDYKIPIYTFHRHEEMNAYINKILKKSIAIDASPFKAYLFSSEGINYFFLYVHHIIFDGYSLEIFLDKLIDLYNSEETDVLLEPSILLSQSTNIYNDEARNYFKDVLNPMPQMALIPVDFPLNDGLYGLPISSKLELNSTLYDNLVSFSKANNVSVFSTVSASLVYLSSYFANVSETIASIPYGLRKNPKEARVVDNFVDLVPIILRINEGETFLAIVKSTYHQILMIDKYWGYDFNDLSRVINLDPIYYKKASTALVIAEEFDYNTILENNRSGIIYHSRPSPFANYPVTCFILVKHDSVQLRFEFSGTQYTQSTVDSFVDSFKFFIDGALKFPNIPLSNLLKLNDQNSERIALLGLGPKTPYPKTETLFTLFKETVRLNSNNVALVHNDTYITYEALDYYSDLIFTQLSELNISAPLVILLPKGGDRYYCVIAAIKLGIAYVPLDSNDPPDHLSLRIMQLQTFVLITSRVYKGKISINGNRSYYIEDILTGVKTKKPDDSKTTNSLSPAYIMFTSGSTGIPKVVSVPHRAIIRLVKNTNIAAFDSNTCFAQISNFSFDASTLEFWGAILNGGKLTIPSNEILYDPLLLCNFIKEQEVNSGFFTVSLFRRMLEARPEDLRNVENLIIGGEPVPSELISLALKYLSPHQILNGYGPTENTTFSCVYRCETEFNPKYTFPIGSAISNSSAYIVDEKLKLKPIGAIGEILVGGDGLALGYLNDLELTEQKFIASYIKNGENNRYYRTGDYGRLNQQGKIEFIGRLDRQVKIRGFRVDLGELETCLKSIAGVKSTSVFTTKNATTTENQIIAGVEAINSVTERDIFMALKNKLPSYLIPSRLKVFYKFPITGNGKVDYIQIAALAIGSTHQTSTDTMSLNAIQKALLKIWVKILETDQVGIDDNFFEMGGTSLSIVNMREIISKEFNIDLKISEIFANPTIASLAKTISEITKANGSENKLLSKVQNRLAKRKHFMRKD